MKLMRYAAKYYLGATFITLSGLVVLLIAVSLIEQAGKLSEKAGALTALRLAGYNVIEQGFQVLPIAAFFGALIAGTAMARSGELMAMQCAGLSPRRVWMAFVLVAAGFGGLGVGCGEYLVPDALQSIERIHRKELGRGAGKLGRYFEKRNHWFRQGEKILYLPEVNSKTEIFSDPVIYTFKDQTIDTVIAAQSLSHGKEGWQLKNGVRYSANDPVEERLPLAAVALDVKPRDLIDITGHPRQLSSKALALLIERRQQAGFDVRAHRMEWHHRIAYPLWSLWMVLLISPWAVRPGRERSLASTLGLGVIAMAALLATGQTITMLALSDTLPVVVGAWGMAFLTLGLLPVNAWALRRWA